MNAPPTALSRHAAQDRASLVARVLMGRAGPVQQGVKRLLITLPAYIFACGLVLISVRLGRLPPEAFWVLAAYLSSGAAVFYALLRSGVVARTSDPNLAYPQVLFHIGAVVVAYVFIATARGFALQWLCIILVFDMRRLSIAQVRVATIVAIVLLMATVAVQWFRLGPRMHLASELINVGMASVTLPLLLFVAKSARRLRRQLGEQRAELAQALAQMRALSVRDGLTKLYTRRHMLTLLDEEVARQKRVGEPFCVALLDIDHFKKVNDCHGHVVGDSVLRQFALILQGVADGGQAIGRWGGEEFLVLIPATPSDQGLKVLERLRLAVVRHDWTTLAPGLALSFSAGLCEHQSTRPIQQTLEQADRALYGAKAQGRNRVEAAEEVKP